MYKVSIIVPVYNVEAYLPECLDSIINQTYTNLEIILVDDGSTDRSGEISEQYRTTDPRIHVIHQENGGLSSARNTGLKQATGTFVFFLDSDDYLERNGIEQVMAAQMQYEADIIVSNYYYSYTQSETIAVGGEDFTAVLNNADAMRQLMTGTIQSFAWGKLFRRSIIKDHFFPCGKLFEDQFWTHRIFAEANSVVTIKAPTVHYRQRNNSISYTFRPERLDILDGWTERIEFLKAAYPELLQPYLKSLGSQYLTLSWLVLKKMRNGRRICICKLRRFAAHTQFAEHCDASTSRAIRLFEKNVLLFASWYIGVKISHHIGGRRRKTCRS